LNKTVVCIYDELLLTENLASPLFDAEEETFFLKRKKEET